MKTLEKNLLVCLCIVAVWLLSPSNIKAQYQFGYLSYQKALQNMPEYATSQTSLNQLKEKYDNEAKYNEEKFRKMFADFLSGQKTFPQEIMLKRQKELQLAMEQGISFRKDAERQLSKAESDMMTPLTMKLDSILGIIGNENGFIFIVNTDNHDFPFIHSHAGKDLTEIVIARLNGKILPIDSPTQKATEAQEGKTTTEPTEKVKAKAPEEAVKTEKK
jgi:outer membrane protein